MGEKLHNKVAVSQCMVHGENIDHVQKKALNSDFNWGPVHGENKLLK